MCEKQELILKLGEQISVLSEIMNQLTEISKEIPPENKQKMKPICDALGKARKEIMKIHEKMRRLRREKE